MLHLSDAWGRRHDPNVVLLHYDDLLADLDGAMRRLAAQLGIAVDGAVAGPGSSGPPPSKRCGSARARRPPTRSAC